eukprot:scaffold320961_cov46-Prasinocladus_malaysianus.AAC.1
MLDGLASRLLVLVRIGVVQETRQPLQPTPALLNHDLRAKPPVFRGRNLIASSVSAAPGRFLPARHDAYYLRWAQQYDNTGIRALQVPGSTAAA